MNPRPYIDPEPRPDSLLQPFLGKQGPECKVFSEVKPEN